MPYLKNINKRVPNFEMFEEYSCVNCGFIDYKATTPGPTGFNISFHIKNWTELKDENGKVIRYCVKCSRKIKINKILNGI